MSHDPAEFPVAREPWDTDAAHLISPGEIATPPHTLGQGEAFTNPADAWDAAVVFTAEHTISDVIRYAISLADFEEVETLLAMMKVPA